MSVGQLFQPFQGVELVFEASSGPYCVGGEVVEGDVDLIVQVLDRSASVGHAGCNHEGVEGPSLLAALKRVARVLMR